jgi:ABC-2 type transport system ATP-binding protein
MIAIDDLVKRFGRTTAVDHVSFRVEPGEIVGFLGPNGAGKTTTIRVLTCFHPPSSGRAAVGGHDCFDEPLAVRRHIGYLPQDVPIYPEMRVREYLHYRATLKGVPRRERRVAVERAMERAAVGEVRRKLVRQISHGYRQRVGLADALVASPPVLILDEPTSGLDPNQRVRMKELVRELAADHTILFSSHILAEVADVADRVVIIHRGAKKADGTIPDLLRHAPGRRLVVTLRCGADGVVSEADLASIVEGLDGVGAAELARADDAIVVAWPLAAEADPRDAINDRIVARGLRLRELRLELPTLETFFYGVTEGEAGLDEGVAVLGESDRGGGAASAPAQPRDGPVAPLGASGEGGAR